MDPDMAIRFLRKDFCARFNIDPEDIPADQDDDLKEFILIAFTAGYDHRANDQNLKAKPVLMKTQFGEVIDEFPSVRAAARHLQRSPGNISRVLRSKQHIAYGYRWSYKNEEDEEDTG
jgi:hypothetical protein